MARRRPKTFAQARILLSDAEPLMRRALAIDEVSLGPDHPNVARNLNNLALSIAQGHQPVSDVLVGEIGRSPAQIRARLEGIGRPARATLEGQSGRLVDSLECGSDNTPARYPVTLFTSLVCCTITECHGSKLNQPPMVEMTQPVEPA